LSSAANAATVRGLSFVSKKKPGRDAGANVVFKSQGHPPLAINGSMH
jgi:hypothetical protein